MHPFDFVAGFPGWGWGRKRKFHGWGGGWIIPAMIIGRIIEEALEQQNQNPHWPQPPAPPSSPAGPRPQPQAGPPPSPWSEPIAATASAPTTLPQECFYCGRTLAPDGQNCPGCGAHVRSHSPYT